VAGVALYLLTKTAFQPLKIWRPSRPPREQARSHMSGALSSIQPVMQNPQDLHLITCQHASPIQLAQIRCQ